MAAVSIVLGVLAVLALLPGRSGSSRPPGAGAPLPAVDPERPLTVVMRGWLWDPASRAVAPPLSRFPARVNEVLLREYGITTGFVQYEWSRVPADLVASVDEFTAYARSAAEEAARHGRCVNFLGHSAGAALVYNAAARGIRMGYMGTLGLPTLGGAKPSSVFEWANFYTTTHIDDVAGLLWAERMKADVNIDLRLPHRDFWGAEATARASADGIARSWTQCRP